MRLQFYQIIYLLSLSLVTFQNILKHSCYFHSVITEILKIFSFFFYDVINIAAYKIHNIMLKHVNLLVMSCPWILSIKNIVSYMWLVSDIYFPMYNQAKKKTADVLHNSFSTLFLSWKCHILSNAIYMKYHICRIKRFRFFVVCAIQYRKINKVFSFQFSFLIQ